MISFTETTISIITNILNNNIVKTVNKTKN